MHFSIASNARRHSRSCPGNYFLCEGYNVKISLIFPCAYLALARESIQPYSAQDQLPAIKVSQEEAGIHRSRERREDQSSHRLQALEEGSHAAEYRPVSRANLIVRVG